MLWADPLILEGLSAESALVQQAGLQIIIILSFLRVSPKHGSACGTWVDPQPPPNPALIQALPVNQAPGVYLDPFLNCGGSTDALA